jgi:Ni/Fe-hydrogenase subunit HybB-like protein
MLKLVSSRAARVDQRLDKKLMNLIAAIGRLLPVSWGSVAGWCAAFFWRLAGSSHRASLWMWEENHVRSPFS